MRRRIRSADEIPWNPELPDPAETGRQLARLASPMDRIRYSFETSELVRQMYPVLMAIPAIKADPAIYRGLLHWMLEVRLEACSEFDRLYPASTEVPHGDA